MNRIKVVEALIAIDNKLLVLHHNKINKITPPVGKIKNNESPYQALVREVYEELDIGISSTRCLGTFEFSIPSRKEIVITTVFAISKWIGFPINKEPDKHSKLEYLSLPEIELAITEGKASPSLIYMYNDKMLGIT